MIGNHFFKLSINLNHLNLKLPLKMNELIQNNAIEFSITLKEITDIIEVRHDKAMRKVEELTKEPSFGEVSKIDTFNLNNVKVITYVLNKKQAIAVGAKLNNALLMKLIDKIEEIESASQSASNFQIPQTLSGALLLASKQAEIIEQQQLSLEQKSQTIANVVHSGNTYTASQVAKDMPNPISAHLLNKMLNEAGIIFWQNGSWQLYAKYANHNLTQIKETKPDADGRTFPSLRWTALGKSWIYKNWTEIKQRVAAETLSEWELRITSNLPKVPMPNKQDRNF